MIRNVLVVVSLLTAGCAADPLADSPVAVEPSREDMISDGRDIAEAQCARCHAVGPYGDSANRDAPLFRTLLSRYSADVLEEELIEGVQVAHPMPEFQFNPQGTDALIAYLQSIQQPSAPQQ